MNKMQPLLERFHAAILEGSAEKSVPDVKRNPRLPVEKQLAIYIDGYRIRLTEAIRSDYPALLALVGNDIFDQWAGEFIEQNPPCGYNLDRYTHAFSAFVSTQTPVECAADLAKLEGAIAEVFMAEESIALEPEALTTLTPEDFNDLILKPRKASKLLQFNYPVDDYLTHIRGGKSPTHPAPAPIYLCVLRHQNEVRRYSLDEKEYHALIKLGKGTPVGTALAKGSEMEIRHWFGRWITHGFFTK